MALGHETAQTGWHRAGDSVKANLPPPPPRDRPVLPGTARKHKGEVGVAWADRNGSN